MKFHNCHHAFACARRVVKMKFVVNDWQGFSANFLWLGLLHSTIGGESIWFNQCGLIWRRRVKIQSGNKSAASLLLACQPSSLLCVAHGWVTSPLQQWMDLMRSLRKFSLSTTKSKVSSKHYTVLCRVKLINLSFISIRVFNSLFLKKFHFF